MRTPKQRNNERVPLSSKESSSHKSLNDPPTRASVPSSSSSPSSAAAAVITTTTTKEMYTIAFSNETQRKLYEFYLSFAKTSVEKEIVRLLNYHGTSEKNLKQILNTFYNTLVGGGPFNPTKNNVFVNAGMVNHIFALLPFFDETNQCEILDTFIVMLEECTLDCAMTSDQHLVQQILYTLHHNDDHFHLPVPTVQKLIYLIGILGSHNISARELKYLLRYTRKKDGGLHKELAPLIFEMIRKMARAESPSSFFNFDGKDCGLLSENIYFPSTGGYSFCCWIRIERITQRHPSRLITLIEKSEYGLEILFKGNRLIIQVLQPKNKVTSVTMNHFFHTNRWYFLCITHTRKYLASSQVVLYVDGEVKQTADLKYPYMGGTKLAFSHIATNIPYVQNGSNSSYITSFCGQCGSIVLFDRALAIAEVERIHKAGPDFQFIFRKGDFPPLYFDFPNLEIYHKSLYFLYNPRACTMRRICLDNSLWKKNWDSNARMLQSTCVLISRKVRETLNCIGGIHVLFPLFDFLVDNWAIEYSMAALIIAMINEMIKNNYEQVLKSNALCTLGFILSEVPPKFINHDTLKALQGIVEVTIAQTNSTLAANGNRKSVNIEQTIEFTPILREIFIHIFLNFQFWCNIEINVQKDMLIFMREQVALNPQYFLKEVGIQYILDVLRYYYWYNQNESIQKMSSKTSGANSNTDLIYNRKLNDKKEIKHVRFQLIEMMKLMITHGVREEDVQAILRFLLDCTDDEQVYELLRFLLVLLDEEIPHLIEYVSDEKSFLNVFMTLLDKKNRELRLYSLKVIGKILEKLSSDKKSKFESSGGCLLVEHTLVAHDFDMETYAALMEVILNHVSYKINTKLTVDLSQVTISLPHILGPFFHILSDQAMPIRERILGDFNVLLKSSAENRKLFAKQDSWQNWLLQLLVPKEKSFSPQKTVFDLVMDNLTVILSEFLNIKDGYKHVRDTISYIDILSERKDVQAAPIYISMFNYLLPFFVTKISQVEFSKEQPFWENAYHIAEYVEEFVMFSNMYDVIFTDSKEDVAPSSSNLPSTNPESNTENVPYLAAQSVMIEKTNIAKYMTLGFDYLIKSSLRDIKAMEILHYHHFREKRTFSIQTIISIASEITSHTKNIIPNKSLFLILIRLQLFLIQNLEPKEANEISHKLRLMGLLCMDIEHSKVPKLHWKGEVTDMDNTNQRILYVLAKMIMEMNSDRFIIIPVLKALLRKNKRMLSAIAINSEVKDLFSKPSFISSFDQEAEDEEFILSFKGEWNCILESEPFKSVIKEVANEVENCRKQYIEKKEKRVSSAIQDIEKAISSDISALKKVISESLKSKQSLMFEEFQRMSNWRHGQRRMKLIALNEWKVMKEDMFNNHGVWSADNSQKKSFYILDLTENALRMRMRLLYNPRGTDHKDAMLRPTQTSTSEKTPLSPGTDDDDSATTNSELFGSFIKTKKNKKDQNEEDNNNVSDEENSDQEDDEENVEETKIEEEGWESVSKNDDQNDSGLLSRTKEEVTIKIFNVEFVRRLNAIKGTLEITNTYLYFITDKDSQEGQYDHKWKIDDIKEIFKRRYLLQHIALEFFFKDRTNVFFNFESTSNLKSFIATLSTVNYKVHYHSSSPHTLVKRSKITQKWVRREISNFEYLMALNTFANRSYNDLTQYPVFPWVLKDYESSSIDLSDPSKYRDLSKPIGALNPERLKQIVERYNSFSDPNIPKFHYGSHYSSVGTVLYYLVRLEPFTEYNIQMQGGTFDLPDRMFHSIATTWNNCMSSMADVKELIPEFFYCPEFLKNLNRLPLGEKQSQEILDDIVLPKWAKTAEEFVHINREALESEYVSQHLHEWIDLIFGYKQMGKEAEKAHNLFYYLTYEGAVNLEEIDDPTLKKSIETQISNFGQTPSQLFKKAHPKREAKSKFDRPSYWKLDNSKPYFATQIIESENQMNQASHNLACDLIFMQYLPSQDKIYVVNGKRELQAFNWLKSKPAMIMASPIGLPMASDIHLSSLCFSSSMDGKWIFSAGHFDKSIKASAVFDRLMTKQSLFEHKDVVTCIEISEDGTKLVSGSKDATVSIWDVDSKSNSKPLSLQPNVTLYGHEQQVVCLDINMDLDVVVSGDLDGCCMIHTARYGKFIRAIRHPLRNTLHIVRIAPSGHVLMYSGFDRILYAYTMNGTLTASVKCDDEIRALVVTHNSKFVITGGRRRRVVIRRLHDLEELHTFEGLSGDIQCMCLRDQINLIAGLDNGHILCFAIDEELLSKTSIVKDALKNQK